MTNKPVKKNKVNSELEVIEEQEELYAKVENLFNMLDDQQKKEFLITELNKFLKIPYSFILVCGGRGGKFL